MLTAVLASMGCFSEGDIKYSLKGQSWALKMTEGALGELDWSLNLALIITISWLFFEIRFYLVAQGGLELTLQQICF